jgi:uncharacterized membrane protein
MPSWTEFVVAGLLFLVTHRIPTNPSVRQAVADRVGETAFVIAYSLLSILMLAWLIVAAGRAPYVELWPFETWQVWVPVLAMAFACAIAAFSIGAPNPLSFGGGNPSAFNPDQPGFVGFFRHGLLWALAIWSTAHIVPNGNLAHVILFGVFATFSIFGMAMIDRRKKRLLGAAEWSRLSAKTSFWPGQSILAGRWRPAGPFLTAGNILRAAAAVLVYLGLLHSHTWFIGVDPLPR